MVQLYALSFGCGIVSYHGTRSRNDAAVMQTSNFEIKQALVSNSFVVFWIICTDHS